MTTPPTMAPDAAQRLQRLDAYLAQDPSNALLRADAFDTAMAAGRLDLAARFLQADSLAGDEWVLRHAALAMAEARYGDCVQLLEAHIPDAAPADGTPTSLVLMWLRASHHTGRIAPAWAWVDARLKEEGGIAPPIAAVASLLAVDAGQVATAGQLADIALPAFPDSREALVAKGTAELARRNVAQAERLALAALQLKDDGRARSLLAFTHMMAGRLEEAASHFDRAVQLMPGHVGTWQGLGWLRLCMGDREGARAAFSSALALDRNFADNHGSLAVVDAIEGREAEARQRIERAKRLDARGTSAQYAEAVLSGAAAADPQTMMKLAQVAIGLGVYG